MQSHQTHEVRRTYGSVLALLCVATIATACGHDASNHNVSEPPISSVPVLLSAADLALPVQEYLPTAEYHDEVDRARILLIKSCMTRFGLSYSFEAVTKGAFGPRTLTDRRYGITDLALAQSDGYGLGQRDPRFQQRTSRHPLDPNQQNVLYGQGQSMVTGIEVPRGGCIGEADRFLDKELPDGVDINLGQRLQLRSFQISRTDSRVVAANNSWSMCMARVGYHYADPLAAASDPTLAGEVNAGQIAVAKEDIRCKFETNLVGIWFTVESAYEQREIDGNMRKFSAVKAALLIRQRNAAAVSAQVRDAAGHGLAG